MVTGAPVQTSALYRKKGLSKTPNRIPDSDAMGLSTTQPCTVPAVGGRGGWNMPPRVKCLTWRQRSTQVDCHDIHTPEANVSIPNFTSEYREISKRNEASSYLVYYFHVGSKCRVSQSPAPWSRERSRPFIQVQASHFF